MWLSVLLMRSIGGLQIEDSQLLFDFRIIVAFSFTVITDHLYLLITLFSCTCNRIHKWERIDDIPERRACSRIRPPEEGKGGKMDFSLFKVNLEYNWLPWLRSNHCKLDHSISHCPGTPWNDTNFRTFINFIFLFFSATKKIASLAQNFIRGVRSRIGDSREVLIALSEHQLGRIGRSAIEFLEMIDAEEMTHLVCKWNIKTRFQYRNNHFGFVRMNSQFSLHCKFPTIELLLQLAKSLSLQLTWVSGFSALVGGLDAIQIVSSTFRCKEKEI